MKTFEINGVKISVGLNEEHSENVNAVAEKEVLEKWVQFLNDRYMTNDFIIEQNAGDYSTISFKGSDFLRLHYGEKAKWVRLLIASAYKKQYIEDIRFIDEPNKNKVFWRMYIDNDDINAFVDILDEEYDFITK